MFYKFYGFTGINIILTGMSAKLYSKCLENLKDEPEILLSLSRQFDNINKVVSEIPDEYTDPQDKRMLARLRILEKSNPNDPKIEEIRNSLKSKPKDIAPFVYVNGERFEISDTAKAIILKLKESKSTIDRFNSFIKVNRVSEKEVLFFNQPLYRLKNFSRARLTLITSSVVKSNSTRTGLTEDFWNYIERFISFVKQYSGEGGITTEDLSKSVVTEVGDFVSKLDTDYLNILLGLNCTEEDYHKASIELYNIGLVGFTPFFNEFYREFLNSFKPNYSSDLRVSTSSDLYKFILDLERAVQSNLNLGDSLIPNEQVEISLEM